MTGEPIPSNFAQEVYLAHAQMQYDGQHVLVEKTCGRSVSMANVLNLSGGEAAWLTMNAQIQSMVTRYGFGTTTIRTGPAAQLGIQSMLESYRMTFQRFVFHNPAERLSSQASSAALGLGQSPMQNSAAQIPISQSHAVTAQVNGETVTAILDALNGVIQLKSTDANGGSVSLALGDLLKAAPGGGPVDAKFMTVVAFSQVDNQWHTFTVPAADLGASAAPPTGGGGLPFGYAGRVLEVWDGCTKRTRGFICTDYLS